MSTTELNLDYSLFIPEFLLVGLVVLLVVAGPVSCRRCGKSWLAYIAAAGLLAVAGVSLAYVDTSTATSRASSSSTTTRRSSACFFMAIAAVICLASAKLVEEHFTHPGEYFALLILSTIGAIGMAASRELMTAYLSLELLSFSPVRPRLLPEVRRALERGRPQVHAARRLRVGDVPLRHEPIYGITGSTYYSEIAASAVAAARASIDWALLMGLVLIVAGLGFKVAAVPFHMWTPDAYEGALLADHGVPLDDVEGGGIRAAAGAVLQAFEVVDDDWSWMIAGLAAATMILGNLVALQQHNIKRLMAYSSIGQVGYMLMGIAGLSSDTASALVLHMTGYMVTNLAVFVVIIAWHNLTGNGRDRRLPRHARARAAAGGGARGRAVLARGAAAVRRLRHEVHPLPGGRGTRASTGSRRSRVVTSVISLYYYLQVMRRAFVDASLRRARRSRCACRC